MEFIVTNPNHIVATVLHDLTMFADDGSQFVVVPGRRLVVTDASASDWWRGYIAGERIVGEPSEGRFLPDLSLLEFSPLMVRL